MLTFLRNIVEAVLLIPQYIMWAVESLWNLLMDAIQAIFNLATALIPLPTEPSPPEPIGEINWFFPIGALISIAVPIVLGYIAFLAIRWILRWSGEL